MFCTVMCLLRSNTQSLDGPLWWAFQQWCSCSWNILHSCPTLIIGLRINSRATDVPNNASCVRLHLVSLFWENGRAVLTASSMPCDSFLAFNSKYIAINRRHACRHPVTRNIPHVLQPSTPSLAAKLPAQTALPGVWISIMGMLKLPTWPSV